MALQICLHLNKYLNFLWFGSQTLFGMSNLEQQHSSSTSPPTTTSNALTPSEMYGFLWQASFLLFCATELVRLYCGNVGNLHEKVSWMLPPPTRCSINVNLFGALDLWRSKTKDAAHVGLCLPLVVSSAAQPCVPSGGAAAVASLPPAPDLPQSTSLLPPRRRNPPRVCASAHHVASNLPAQPRLSGPPPDHRNIPLVCHHYPGRRCD